MKTVSLSGSLRENVGKKDAKINRRNGRVPCVVYGGKEQLHFTIMENEFNKLVFTPDVYLITLDINGKEVKAVMQDVQYHPVSDRALHADFLEVLEGKPVSTAVPIRLIGTSLGILAGGKLVQKFRKINVRGMVDDIPEELVIDITDLEIGDSFKVRDLEIDKLDLLDTPSAEVVSVKVTRTATGMDLPEDEIEEEVGEEGEEGEGEGTEAAATE